MFTTVRILFYLIVRIHNRMYKLQFTITQRRYVLRFSRQRLKCSRLWHHAALQVEGTGPQADTEMIRLYLHSPSPHSDWPHSLLPAMWLTHILPTITTPLTWNLFLQPLRWRQDIPHEGRCQPTKLNGVKT